jgi:hypothetical protein
MGMRHTRIREAPTRSVGLTSAAMIATNTTERPRPFFLWALNSAGPRSGPFYWLARFARAAGHKSRLVTREGRNRPRILAVSEGKLVQRCADERCSFQGTDRTTHAGEVDVTPSGRANGTQGHSIRCNVLATQTSDEAAGRRGAVVRAQRPRGTRERTWREKEQRRCTVRVGAI